MPRNLWGPLSQRMQDAISPVTQPVRNWVQELQDIPHKASEIAEGNFVGSARDASAKNAFRHALGTGMMANHLGGGILGGTAAKLMGYAWEAPTLMDPRSTPAQRMDSRHDLNANALGAYLAAQGMGQEDLVKALRGYAVKSSVQDAPGVFERPIPRLTRTVR